MYNHAPKKYPCPFCGVSRLEENELTKFKKDFLVYRDKFLTAFMSLMKWPPCAGIVLIIPNKHYENLYDMPDSLLSKTEILAKKIALAMKESYACDGVSLRQHNEPAGNQSVWHYHLQVFPRYNGDNLYANHVKSKTPTPDTERKKYAKMLRSKLTLNIL